MKNERISFLKYNFRKKLLSQSCPLPHISILAACLPFGLLYFLVYLVFTHQCCRQQPQHSSDISNRLSVRSKLIYSLNLKFAHGQQNEKQIPRLWLHSRGRFTLRGVRVALTVFAIRGRVRPRLCHACVRFVCERLQQSFLIVVGRLTSSAREENLHQTNEGGAHQERSSHPRSRFVSDFLVVSAFPYQKKPKQNKATAVLLSELWRRMSVCKSTTASLSSRRNHQQRESERPCHDQRNDRGGQSSHWISRDPESGAGEGTRERDWWHWG